MYQGKDNDKYNPNMKRVKKHFNQRIKKDSIAIFDIGTKAIRLLIAPKTLPENWSANNFVNDSNIHNIGDFISHENQDINTNSKPIKIIKSFIKAHLNHLKNEGINDIYCIGTAAFRWLGKNQNILRLDQLFNLNMEIIDKDKEGYYTLLAIPEIITRNEADRYIDENDIIVLIDQGGGSLDVSWMQWSERNKSNPNIKGENFDNLGTVALRSDFFSLDQYGQEVDPLKNRTRISSQITRTQKDAKRTLASWREHSAHFLNKRIHVFCVGSAATNVYQGGTLAVHGKTLDQELIETTLKRNNQTFDNNKQQVLTLYKKMHDIDGEGVAKLPNKSELEKTLTMLYGLPVYNEVLNKFKVNHSEIFGYGLRYGYYIWKSLQQDKKMEDYQIDSDGPFAFISYARKDAIEVYRYANLFFSRGMRIWYDRKLQGGENYGAKLATKIEQSSAVLVFISENSIHSENVAREIEIAIKYNKTIIPIRLQDVAYSKALEWPLILKHYINSYNISEDLLLSELRNSLDQCIWK